MQSITLIRFQTSDGSLFESEHEAKAHEALLTERATILNFATSIAPENQRHRSRLVSTLESYIQFRASAV